MEFIVTSYKDRRKTPCEAAEPSLRTYFDGFASVTGSARLGVETLRVCNFSFVACNSLCRCGDGGVCGG
jgi:hypothetical protein